MKGQECQFSYYHSRQNICYQCSTDSRICHCIQTKIHFLLSCWLLYMSLLYMPIHSIQPPSNSVQTDSLYTEPAHAAQICLNDQDTADDLWCVLPFCCPQTGWVECVLCLDPVWDHMHLNTRRDITTTLRTFFWALNVCVCSGIYGSWGILWQM